MSRGYFAVGVFHPKTEANVGSLYRTALLYGAAFVFTVGRRYRLQASDTPKTERQIPLFHFESIADLREHLPKGAPLVGVELDDASQPLRQFSHPRTAVYLLGAEDSGLPAYVLDECHELVVIESVEPQSMNVANAGSIVIYDRFAKRQGDTE